MSTEVGWKNGREVPGEKRVKFKSIRCLVSVSIMAGGLTMVLAASEPWADADFDDDVDMADYAEFLLCFTGPKESPNYEPPDEICLVFFDRDHDDDVDLLDARPFTCGGGGPTVALVGDDCQTHSFSCTILCQRPNGTLEDREISEPYQSYDDEDAGDDCERDVRAGRFGAPCPTAGATFIRCSCE